MKKSVLLASFAFAVVMASAQSVQKNDAPKPPPPPKPPVVNLKEAPPPPPAEPTPPDAPPPPPAIEAQMQDEDAFMKKNPSVKSVQWKNGDVLIIGLKSGKEESYNLNDAASKKAAEAKYGTLPQAPPPPPPPPPPPLRKKRTLS